MRNFTIIDAPQKSPAWFQARAKRICGSDAKDLLASVRSGEAAARRDLRTRLVVEKLTDTPYDTGNGFVNEAMAWGSAHEDEALAAYEALTGNVVIRTGFIAHNELPIGVSLDGHIGDVVGCVEAKCPKSATHFGYLRGPAELPAEHRPQILHQLLVTDAQWCDFLSFDPRMPSHLRTFYVRYLRNDVEIEAYAAKVRVFLEEVEREYQAALGWHAVEAAHV
jgi:hypothetical protein